MTQPGRCKLWLLLPCWLSRSLAASKDFQVCSEEAAKEEKEEGEGEKEEGEGEKEGGTERDFEGLPLTSLASLEMPGGGEVFPPLLIPGAVCGQTLAV